jgi:hypothetical protein
MYPKPTLLDDLEYLFNSHLATIINLKCRSSEIAAIDSRKDEAVKQRFVFRIKRAIDKNARREFSSGPISGNAWH